VIKPLSANCTPRDSVFTGSRNDTALDLTDFLDGKIGIDFLEENYFTDGLLQLGRLGLRRLAGHSDQGIYVLSQSMGGGKTHGMITLGLLCLHPDVREKSLGQHYDKSAQPGDVRVIGFSGRENDTPLGIWGSLADQLGKKSAFADYYSPLAAPGQSAWINLLQGPPTLILLDELPPYFQDAKSKTVGNSDLANVTTTALSNLLVAVNKPELKNVCIVIADLKATYEGGGASLNAALTNLQNETTRSAQSLAPVALNNDEIFHILRTRLFRKLPDPADITAIADAYAQSVKDARGMDLTAANPQDYRAGLISSYPFHFSLRDLYARFRENPGYQQTRALIKLMRVITARMWNSKAADGKFLIHPYDIDLNDQETRSEIEAINPKLGNAIAHDIASSGSSIAEIIDRDLGNATTDCRDLASLLLVSSLSTVSGAAHGLNLNDIISYLSAPGREVAHLNKNVIGPYQTRAWYLHTDREGRLYFKDVQNIVAKLNSQAQGFTREIKLKELQSFLEKSFEPKKHRDCYQKVIALTAPDELKLERDSVLLVIAEPKTGSALDPQLRKFYEDATYQNRVVFLTGDREVVTHLLDRSAELKAIEAIIKELESENTSGNDPQLNNAREMRDNILLQLLSAAKEGFNVLHYPAKDGLRTADFLMNFQDNEYNGEAQVREALAGKQKFTTEIDTPAFRSKCEQRLFTQHVMDYADVTARAATNPAWQWHIPSALETMKSRLIAEGAWRADGSLIDKGPFPAPKTDVRVQLLSRNDETGEATLKITPIAADRVHYEISSTATKGSAPVTDFHNFRSTDLRLSFLAIDSTGNSDPGPARFWENTITLKHRFYTQGGQRMCELSSAPPAPIHYSTDGTTPNEGSASYVSPFPVPEGTICILAMAAKDGVKSQVLRKDVPREDAKIVVDPTWLTTFRRQQKFQNVKDAYDFLGAIGKINARVTGLTATIGSDQWMELATDPATPLTRAQIDSLLDPMRKILGEGSIILRCEAVIFASGQDFEHWAADHKLDVREDEIIQTEPKSPE
jgi:predicted AAA+ superfamily ATPase